MRARERIRERNDSESYKIGETMERGQDKAKKAQK
jgi:hypothetical protein